VYRVILHILQRVTKCRIYYLNEMEEISLFLDVWMYRVLISVLYYNNFSILII